MKIIIWRLIAKLFRVDFYMLRSNNPSNKIIEARSIYIYSLWLYDYMPKDISLYIGLSPTVVNNDLKRIGANPTQKVLAKKIVLQAKQELEKAIKQKISFIN